MKRVVGLFIGCALLLACNDTVSGTQGSSSTVESSEVSEGNSSSEGTPSSDTDDELSTHSSDHDVVSSDISGSISSDNSGIISSAPVEISSVEALSSQALSFSSEDEAVSSEPFDQEKWDNFRKDTDYIYDLTTIRSYELLLDPDSLAYLDAMPTREDYVEGRMVFEGDTIGPIGVRYKGSIGAFSGCKEGNMFDPTGRKIDNGKCSVKLKFNWGEEYEKFHGLKKLQFHATNSDHSKMHDRLGYYLFREFGVPTSRSSHAHLTINGRYAGLYALVEQIDGRFVNYHYPQDSDGNLYKKRWPVDAVGDIVAQDTLLKYLKTNEEEANVSDMLAFGQAVIDASTDTELKQVMEEWFDVEEMLRYIVVDRAIANDDGMYKWYCKPDKALCHNHNLYWYQERNSKRVHIIPWDLDGAFDNVNLDNIKSIWSLVQDDWDETQNNCDIFNGAGEAAESLQISGACNKVLKGFTLFKEEHDALKREFYQDYLNPGFINAKVDEWMWVMDEAVKRDAHEFFNDPSKYDQWKSALNELKGDLAASIGQREL
ncbi:MAG: CotH kinase family protein [Fibrobacterales bacterium]